MAADTILWTPTRANQKRRLGTHAVREFLELGIPALDVTVWDDDFQGDTLHGSYQSTANGTASAVAAISTGVVNGAAILETGTDTDGRSDLSLGLHYQGQLNAVCWTRLSLSTAMTSRKFEVGFTDVISGTDAGAVNSKSGNTFTATDAAVLCLDTSDDALLTLMGTKNGTPATVIDLGTALSHSTYYYLGVVLQGTSAKGILLNADGRKIEETAWMTNAITETVLLTPWVFAQTRTTASRAVVVDRLTAYQRKTTGN